MHAFLWWLGMGVMLTSAWLLILLAVFSLNVAFSSKFLTSIVLGVVGSSIALCVMLSVSVSATLFQVASGFLTGSILSICVVGFILYGCILLTHEENG